jgi:hypothetical protein
MYVFLHHGGWITYDILVTEAHLARFLPLMRDYSYCDR